MEMSKKMEDAVNGQINAELYSDYLYLGMAAYFDSLNLKGFSHWMHKQANEEFAHAMRFYKFVFERGGKVSFAKIDAVPVKWPSPLAAFQEAYRHEQKVTAMIHNLAEQAEKGKDRATRSFLEWFINEQVEEENQAAEIVQKLKMIGSSANGLMMLDRALAERK